MFGFVSFTSVAANLSTSWQEVTFSSNNSGARKDRKMNFSMKMKDDARQTYAVFVDGACIAHLCQWQKQTGLDCKP
jgi:hypothetical protein